MEHLNIAIDGPSGAGKSTIAKNVAKRLGIRYLDTGAMYRVIGLNAIREGVAFNDAESVADLLIRSDVRVAFTEEGQREYLGDEDVTGLIRTEQVSDAASRISVHPCVRIRLTEMQREIAHNYDVVMDGREIGTNVLPDTPYKFFLTASAEERARRRYEQLVAEGDRSASYEQVLKDVKIRDERDTTRAYMPLVVAPDAVVIDTSNMTIEEATKALISHIPHGSEA